MTHHGRSRIHAREDGFTLVEALVAVMITAILFAAFAGVMISALRAAKINHAAQTATAIGVERLEVARSLSWEELQMDGYPELSPFVSYPNLLGDAVGLPDDEPLVIDFTFTVGAIEREQQVEIGNDNVVYTVEQFVTCVEVASDDDCIASPTDSSVRRMVVHITWQQGDAQFTRMMDTLIAEVAAP